MRDARCEMRSIEGLIGSQGGSRDSSDLGSVGFVSINRSCSRARKDADARDQVYVRINRVHCGRGYKSVSGFSDLPSRVRLQ